MKKATILFFVLAFFAMQASFAQSDCGVVDCVGNCGRFVDANGDGFCDHGQLSKPVVQEVESAESAKSVEKSATNVKPEQESTPEVVTEVIAAEDVESVAETGSIEEPDVQPVEGQKRSPYPVFPILGGLLVLFIISIVLVKCNVWQKSTHRKVWNVALTLTFLVSCLIGVLLAIFINYNYRPQWYIDLLHWHVYVGIAMTIIAIFHALWHLNYFKTLFVKRK